MNEKLYELVYVHLIRILSAPAWYYNSNMVYFTRRRCNILVDKITTRGSAKCYPAKLCDRTRTLHYDEAVFFSTNDKQLISSTHTHARTRMQNIDHNIIK